MKVDHQTRAYIAGVLDCDGSIYIARTSARIYQLRVAVYNSKEQLVGWFKDKLGGNCNNIKRTGAKRSREFCWFVSSLAAAEVISLALPYLVVKRKQALLALEFASTIGGISGGQQLPKPIVDLRAKIYKQICELNKRATVE